MVLEQCQQRAPILVFCSGAGLPHGVGRYDAPACRLLPMLQAQVVVHAWPGLVHPVKSSYTLCSE